jgi:predicted alpha/beta superfamily hydrolase
MRARFPLLVIALALAACGGSTSPLLDGGSLVDGGASLDGGPVLDGGPAADGGSSADGGSPDGGVAGDGGSALTIDFTVVPPASTPANAQVSVVGNAPALGSGQEPGLVLTRDGDGRYQGEVVIAPGTTSVSFRVVRLAPTHATEVDPNGDPVDTRELAVAPGAHAVVTIAAWSDDPELAARPAVTFLVTVPAGTPRFETIRVSGAPAELGAWDGVGLALSHAADGRWVGTQRLANGTTVEFKVTRGSWATVEKAANGSEIANRTLTVNGRTRTEITVAAWTDRPKVTGNVENLGPFHSAFLADRPILVYLPPSYESQPTRRFPVLYLHDGQNVLDSRTAFGGVEWAADETAERLIGEGSIEPLILVAVGNTADRMDEYTQTVDSGEGAGGDADLYGRLLVEELKPVIDSRYRTQPGADTTGLCGSSLGGLVTMYLGLTHSEVFGRLGVVSPSVWWDSRDIVDRVQALTAKLPLRIWEDIGTAEGSGSGPVNDARALRDALLAKGWQVDVDLAYREYAGAQHNETAWAARFDEILKFLFPPR